jgi:hypothetical protein
MFSFIFYRRFSIFLLEIPLCFKLVIEAEGIFISGVEDMCVLYVALRGGSLLPRTPECGC